MQTSGCSCSKNARLTFVIFGGDRHDLHQRLDDGSLANVSGVEYMIDASKVPQGRRVEQARGIIDHADAGGLDIESRPFNT